jgi:hypothetical protein
VLNIFICRADRFFQKSYGGHDLARGAIAALVAIMLDEGGLHGMQIVRLADTLDSGDLFAREHHGKGKAGVYPAAIDVNRACAALTVVAALFGAGKVEPFAEKIEQRYAGFQAGEVVLFAIAAAGGASSAVGAGAGAAAIERGDAPATKLAAPSPERKLRRLTRPCRRFSAEFVVSETGSRSSNC